MYNSIVGCLVNSVSNCGTKIWCNLLRFWYFFNYNYDDNHNVYISFENIDKCLHAMKLGKAAGCDGIETEHMVNAHPILVSILAALFKAMLQHGYVPDNLLGELLFP